LFRRPALWYDPDPMTRVLVVWIHVLAAAVWYGGLMTALVGVKSATAAGAPAAAAALVRRYQGVAWTALGLVLASGVYNTFVWLDALRESPGLARFLWTLTAKVALFGAIVAVTGVQQWVHVRALGAAGDPKALAAYRRLGRANLALGALVLLVGVGLSLWGAW
jgi:putative copper export protein